MPYRDLSACAVRDECTLARTCQTHDKYEFIVR